MDTDPGVRRGFSTKTDASEAVDEIWEQTFQPDAKLTVFFCSSWYDLDKLASRVRERFGNANVVGCTTSGEIGPNGYLERSMSAFSLGGPSFEAATGRIDNLTQFGIEDGRVAVSKLLSELSAKGVRPTPQNTFGFQLSYHLSQREDLVTAALFDAMSGIPLFGGAAGDDLRFENQIFLFHEGKFRSDCWLLNLVSTSRRFELFMTKNFVGRGEKLVITSSDTANNLVLEINGAPAAEEYANALGLNVEDLTTQVFAAHPALVNVQGEMHARPIHKANEDGSLLFGLSIAEGVILMVGESINIVDDLQRAFDELHMKLGKPALTIVCDCAYRRLEITQKGYVEPISHILKNNNSVGFCTYGEQIGPVAAGQTFVAMAISDNKRADPIAK